MYEPICLRAASRERKQAAGREFDSRQDVAGWPVLHRLQPRNSGELDRRKKKKKKGRNEFPPFHEPRVRRDLFPEAGDQTVEKIDRHDFSTSRHVKSEIREFCNHGRTKGILLVIFLVRLFSE